MKHEFAKTIGAGFKDKDKLISQVARHLAKERPNDRQVDCIHPSEAAHEHWCQRATYYRIDGVEPEVMPRGLAMEMVFETGHDAHRKWQNWFWEMGSLKGSWYCLACKTTWEDTSPRNCPNCDAGTSLIQYAEVPVHNDHYLIAGKSDGDVTRADGSETLVEIKTIGVGTIRYEAPNLMAKYTYNHTDLDGKIRSGVDWQSLWNGIRRPFSSHIRQGMLYCFCAEKSEITYIYDPKFVTAYPKEFTVKYNEELIEDILKQCLTIKDALGKGKPPKRPEWAEASCKTCKGCPFKKECWGDRIKDSRFDGADFAEEVGSQSGVAEAEPEPAKKARVRFAEVALEHY